MTKCVKCENHHQRGQVHSCKYCKEKKVVGAMLDPFIEFCDHYKQSEDSKKRERFEHKLKIFEVERAALPPAPEKITAAAIKREMQNNGATCPAVCKQWINGGCFHYGAFHPKAPGCCKYFIEEELIRRRKEAEK